MDGETKRSSFWILQSDESQLIQSSFLMLFVELVLIRWTGSNVIYLSYFSNFILLGSFLGIGIGFMRVNLFRSQFYLSPFLLAAFVAFVCMFPFHVYRLGGDLVFFGDYSDNNTLPAWLFLPIIFVAVTAVMASVTDGVATKFKKFRPLSAYRLDIIGSLLGTAVFAACSFLNAPPLCWAIIISAFFVSLLCREWRLKDSVTIIQVLSLVALVAMFSKETTLPGYFWSPYYKIGVHQGSNNSYSITTNGIPHQNIMSVDARKKSEPIYFIPYQYLKENTQLNNVLIVGAGTGGDVAIALKNGAKHIDAVEIDPVLYRLGKQLNIDKPYDNPRVQVFVGDGRAFLQRTTRRYDMIVFALPDSLTLVSGQSSLRLENYLFTVEAISMVKNHLREGGMFTMYNYYRERWLVDRFINTLRTVFGHSPCVETYGASNHWLSVLMIGRTQSSLECKKIWVPGSSQFSQPSTDNHPFIYLKENVIPFSYAVMLFFVFFASIGSLWAMGGSYATVRNNLDFFFMGAAFLLLETKSIVSFSLLFGTTWLVNALVFFGILLCVLLSIEAADRVKIMNLRPLYGLLFLALLVAWIIPIGSLLTLSAPLRFIAAVALSFSPVFIGNLIFANRFQIASDSMNGFGANLVGAMVGGLAEYASLIIGYQSLIIVVGIFYLAALWSGKVPAKSET